MNRQHRILILAIAAFLLCAVSPVFAANDPGHDSLYVLRVGDTNVTGSINLSGNFVAGTVQWATLLYGTQLDIRANGTILTPGSRPAIQSDANELYLDAITNLRLNTRAGTTGVVQIGPTTGSSVTLNVSGVIRQQNVAVCLSNGTNCINGNNTGNVSTVTAGSGISNSGTASDPVLDVNAGDGITITADQVIINNASVCRTDGTGCPGGAVSGSGWKNSSTLVDLVTNTTNVSIGNATGNLPALYIDARFGRTGFGTQRPTQLVDINGTVNVSTGNLHIQTGVLIIAGTTTISNSRVGTFGSGTTINGINVCLTDGTNCPASANAPLSGWRNDSGNGNVSLVNPNVNVSANTLFIDNTNGKLGINKANPVGRLHIVANNFVRNNTNPAIVIDHTIINNHSDDTLVYRERPSLLINRTVRTNMTGTSSQLIDQGVTVLNDGNVSLLATGDQYYGFTGYQTTSISNYSADATDTIQEVGVGIASSSSLGTTGATSKVGLSVSMYLGSADNAYGAYILSGGATNSYGLYVQSNRNYLLGNTGINIDDNSSALTVYGNLSVYGTDGNSSIDGTTFVVDATNNRIGVGTAAPAATLDVNASSGETYALRVRAVTSATAAAVDIAAGNGSGGSGVAGALTLSAGGGNNAGVSTDGSGGIGGNVTVSAGSGGAGDGVGNGGDAGNVFIRSGTGGDGVVDKPGGNIYLTSGNGGDASAGIGGSTVLRAGDGGTGSGLGGNINLTPGDGKGPGYVYITRSGLRVNGSVSVNSSVNTGSFMVINTTGKPHFFINGNSGQVGIGTAGPSRTLDVNGTVKIDIQSSSEDSNNPIVFTMIGNQTWYYTIPRCASCYVPGAAIGDLVLRGNRAFRITTDGGVSNAFTVTNSSFVGINDSTPATTLEVTSFLRLTPIPNNATAPSCTGANGALINGTFYYDHTRREPCFCNGTAWRQFDGGGTC